MGGPRQGDGQDGQRRGHPGGDHVAVGDLPGHGQDEEVGGRGVEDRRRPRVARGARRG